jgi:hypothetical protein
LPTAQNTSNILATDAALPLASTDHVQKHHRCQNGR